MRHLVENGKTTPQATEQKMQTEKDYLVFVCLLLPGTVLRLSVLDDSTYLEKNVKKTKKNQRNNLTQMCCETVAKEM